MPRDYSQPFEIEGRVGNNALSYERRGLSPKLWVPPIISGTADDVRLGDCIAFEEFDEHDVLHSCTGLANFVRLEWAGVPAVVFDNHNHAFYFWSEALAHAELKPGATLIHIDQHRDTRVPERLYDGASLDDAFAYTNFHLNVGNYIVPAERCGLIEEIQFVTGAAPLQNPGFVERRNKILNIDLDFFAPEMAHVDFQTARRFIASHLKTASLVTIATSPFFIDQERAIATLKRLL